MSIQEFRDSDEPAVVGVWYRAGRAAYPFLPGWQSLTLEHAASIFRELILVRCKIWVGTQDNEVVAYLAMDGSYIDRMYVDPPYWHKGWGSRLIAVAKDRCPDGLHLHTHQENYAARRFYEKHGFKSVTFGTSPPPESAPDVEYSWRPGS